ncbi:MAG TPA: ATP phosphoribosyltransferase [Lacipirellulaceae bacterium]|jgi:ATP phosphoribosyltransferase|nr:ATP phosphoribosyltransferase [Lacipirellulaceae bacterium]
MTENLRIGIPSKGRLAEMASQLLVEAGLKFRRQDRSLFARVRDMPIEVTFLRTDDIPVLCAEGAIDMGITGGDLIDETGVELTTRLPLGMGNWRLSMCVPDDSSIKKPADLASRRIATSFPHVTQKYLEKHQVTAHIVQLTGSVEVMITLGIADAIVDLVETGSTLAANHLMVLDDLGRYEAVLVQNKTTPHTQLADRVVRRLEGIVIARSYSMLEYNVPEEKLREAEKVTPGFESPTISKLEESGWFAVRAMVKRSQVIEIMEQLEALGATAILETTITNCRL